MSDTHHDAILGILEAKQLDGKVRASARHHEMAGKPYRPGSGFEGAEFQARWCDICARDAAFRDDTGDSCPIVADTFAYSIDDPKYPKEWVFDRDGRPSCRAFTAEADNPPRCDKTIDLFERDTASLTNNGEGA